MKELSEIIETNPFYGKEYVVIGEIPSDDYFLGFDYQFELLGAIKETTISSQTDYVFVADKPCIECVEIAKKYHEEGHLIRLPYYSAVEISKLVWNYTNYRLSIYTDRELLDRINEIIEKAKKEGNYTSSGEFLNDRNYYKRKILKEKQKKEEQDEKLLKIILIIFVLAIIALIYFFDLWIAIIVIILLFLFPKVTCDLIGVFFKTILNK